MNDEQLAADYTRDVLIACFSHPAYTGFVNWGIREGKHWKPETGSRDVAMWRKDWTIRETGKVIEEWIGKRWRTKVRLITDADGRAKWRGFPGCYDAKVAGKTIAVHAAGDSSGRVQLP